MIARDGFMQLVPQPFDVINPSAVNWLEYQAELRILLQPSLVLFAFMNDVVIEVRIPAKLNSHSGQCEHPAP